MKRIAAALLTGLSLLACGGSTTTDGDPQRGFDAGTTTRPDGGQPVVDAGPTIVDAGPSDPQLPADISVGEVSLYQAVKVSLATNGAPIARTYAPVVAGREAWIRVGLAPSANFAPRTLGCELWIDPGNASPQDFSASHPVSGASSDADATSFFTFDIPAALITESTRWSARLIDASANPVSGATPSSARIPSDGTTAPLGARTDSGGIQIVLVPIQWNTDGSGRLPDTSDAQLARIRGLLQAVYPMVEVDLTVHAPLPYSGGLTFTGNVDFGDVNSQLQALRQSDNAPFEAYYYALVSPDDSFDDYCGGSCVTGQSYVVDDVTDDELRVGSGQGWSGDNSAWTLAHEVGHQQGRYHAPCEAGDPDPDFPYANGGTGVWGYDPRSASFLSPDVEADFMGYCDPTWASDYTYAALFDRALAIHGAQPRAVARTERYRFLALDALGNARWRRPLELSHPPGARSPQVTATWLDDRGRALRTDRAARLSLGEDDEIELALPEAPTGATSVRVDDAGRITRYLVD